MSRFAPVADGEGVAKDFQQAGSKLLTTPLAEAEPELLKVLLEAHVRPAYSKILSKAKKLSCTLTVAPAQKAKRSQRS